MSAESKMVEYAASYRQVKSPYNNGDKYANAESRQVVGKLDDRVVSLNAVFDILDGIQEDIEDGEGFNYNKWKEAVNELSSVTPQPCEDEYIRVPKKALKYRTAGMVAYNVEWLKNHFDIERDVICGTKILSHRRSDKDDQRTIIY